MTDATLRSIVEARDAAKARAECVKRDDCRMCGGTGRFQKLPEWIPWGVWIPERPICCPSCGGRGF